MKKIFGNDSRGWKKIQLIDKMALFLYLQSNNLTI